MTFPSTVVTAMMLAQNDAKLATSRRLWNDSPNICSYTTDASLDDEESSHASSSRSSLRPIQPTSTKKQQKLEWTMVVDDDSLLGPKQTFFTSDYNMEVEDDDIIICMDSPEWIRMERSASNILRSLKTATVTEKDITTSASATDHSKPTVVKKMRNKPGPKPGWKRAKREAAKAAAALAARTKAISNGTTGSPANAYKTKPVVLAAVTPSPATPRKRLTRNSMHSFRRSSTPDKHFKTPKKAAKKTTTTATNTPSSTSSRNSTPSSPPSPSSSSNIRLTYKELNSFDVMSGRGNGIANFAGNIHFRQLVSTRRLDYSKRPRYQKSIIAQQVIDYIHSRGGRFVERDDENSKEEGEEVVYRIMDPTRVLEKTSQALRERYVHSGGARSGRSGRKKYG